MPVRVYFEDTDCCRRRLPFQLSQILRARALRLHQAAGHRRRGSLADPDQSEPAVFVVRRVEIDYLKPGSMDDLLEVVTSCAQIGSASLVLQQDVQRGDALLVRAKVTVVLVSRTGKPQRLGALVRKPRFNDLLTNRVKRSGCR